MRIPNRRVSCCGAAERRSCSFQRTYSESLLHESHWIIYLFFPSFIIYYIVFVRFFFFLSSFYISVPFECASHLPPMMQIRKKQNKKSAAASDIHSIYMFHYEYWLRLTHHSSQLCAPMPWLSPSIADDQIRCEHIKNIYLYSSYFVAGHEHRQKHEHIISVWQ